MRIDGEGGDTIGLAHDDARRFMTNAGQTFEFFKSLGDFTAEFL